MWCDELSALQSCGLFAKVRYHDFLLNNKVNGKISYFDKLSTNSSAATGRRTAKNELALYKNLIASFKTAKAIDFNQVKLNSMILKSRSRLSTMF